MDTVASKPYGMIAEFTTAASVLHAAERVRDAGFRKWDVFTPFPVHGMDRALGFGESQSGLVRRPGGRPRVPLRHFDDRVDERPGLSDRHRRKADVQPV